MRLRVPREPRDCAVPTRGEHTLVLFTRGTPALRQPHLSHARQPTLSFRSVVYGWGVFPCVMYDRLIAVGTPLRGPMTASDRGGGHSLAPPSARRRSLQGLHTLQPPLLGCHGSARLGVGRTCRHRDFLFLLDCAMMVSKGMRRFIPTDLPSSHPPCSALYSKSSSLRSMLALIG